MLCVNFLKSQTNGFGVYLKERGVKDTYWKMITEGHVINPILLALSEKFERNVRSIQARVAYTLKTSELGEVDEVYHLVYLTPKVHLLTHCVGLYCSKTRC